jgi:hypothetical protein
LAEAESSSESHRKTSIERQKRWAVVLALLGAPWIAFPVGFIPRALLDGGDDLLANLPELLYSARKLLEGEILWTPELWMGHPLLGEPEFASLYLPKLLLLVGPPVVAYAAYLVLHYVMAEAGAYLYLRSLGIGRLGGVFGALAYAYSGFMLGHRAHTMYVCAGAWTPFVLLLFDRATERGGRLRHLAAAVAFAAVPFCGAVQLSVYLAVMILVVAGARWYFERSARPLVGAVACLVPAVLIASAQLAPSYDFSRQLATDMRADYALDVLHSFHPLLFPTIALPVPTLDGELYSRAGVVVVCAAAAALVGLRSAPSKVRAWAVVAAVAGLLMLGRYLPPLARLLHGLPVVGVLRGPARHNFELGLALSVLGAYGVDAARRSGAGSLWRWLLAAAAFAAASYGAVQAIGTRYLADDDAASLLGGVSVAVALAGLAFFVLWVAALYFRRTRSLWFLVGLTPVVETAWVMQFESVPNRSAIGLVEAARAALPEPIRFVRLLSVSLHRGSVDSLAGNSVLFHPHVQSLQGYSSIAYDAAQKVLDLDMHGQPRVYGDLAFSILPSVFGVTDVVLPSLACEDARFSAAGPGPCRRSSLGESADSRARTIELAPAARALECTAVLRDAAWRYRLELGARAPGSDTRGVALTFIEPPFWQKRLSVELPGAMLGPNGARRAAPFQPSRFPDWDGLVLENGSAHAVEFFDVGLYAEHGVTVSVLDAAAWKDLTSESATISGNDIRLEPGEGEARVMRRVRWPKSARSPGMVTLEMEARAPSGTAQDLVVDLYAGTGYDPDDAQIVVPGPSLSPDFRTFRKEFQADGPPEEFFLRAFSLGGPVVEIRSARLLARLDERVNDFPIAANPYPDRVRVNGDRITLAPNSKLSSAMHLPVRAFDLLLDAEAESGLDGPVEFGVHADARVDSPRTWQVDPSVFDGRRRLRRIAVLPPDLAEYRLFVRTEGSKPVAVRELSATDACTLRGYRNPKRLANGLFLYENPNAVPRAYTVGRTVRVASLPEVRQALLDFDGTDLGNRAVVTSDVPRDLRPGVIERMDFGQRWTEMVVRADDAPTLLVDNDRFDADWRVTIDGVSAAILPVNGLVRGVVVPEGRHRVRFEYRAPRSVWIGLVLAIAGVFGALVVGSKERVNERRHGGTLRERH